MTDILDLPGWKAITKQQTAGEYVIEAEYTIHPIARQKCGVIAKPYKHGPKVISYRDSPIRGYPVRIMASVQRYKCRDCGGTYLQPLGGMQADMRMTERCVQYIQSQCLRDTFLRIAEHVGCDDKTVRTLAGEYVAKLNAEYKPWLPEWMGIDETQIDGVLRCIITDVGNRRPVDMLADREKTTVGLVAGAAGSAGAGAGVAGWVLAKAQSAPRVASVAARVPVAASKGMGTKLISAGCQSTPRYRGRVPPSVRLAALMI